MQYYTMEDYIDLLVYVNNTIKNRTATLREEPEKYTLQTKETRKNEKHHKHDKMFRKILNNEKEVAKLINQELDPEKEVKAEDIEKYETKFVSSRYEDKFAENIKTKEEREELLENIFYIWEDRLNEEEKEMIRKIIFKEKRVKGEDNMSHAQEVIRKHEERLERKAKKEGRKESLIDVAKKMLQEKVDIDFIMKMTGLKKEEFMS